MKPATQRIIRFQSHRNRRGVAVLLVLAVLAIAIGLVFALSRSSSSTFKLSANETASLRADSTSDFAPYSVANSLANDANWMPSANPSTGNLASGETYQNNVTITKSGSQRSVASTADVYSLQDKSKVAEQLLTINLAKQARADYPTAAIAAFATSISSTDGPPVYVASGTIIRGNVRSKGPIQFQAGFVLQGIPYVMADISRGGTGTGGYLTYRAAWGTTYPAQALANFGSINGAGTLVLNSVTLGPSSLNPMGVYYHSGDVAIQNQVTISGTLVAKGSVTFTGNTVNLSGLQQAADPTSGTVFKTSFPVLVSDGSIVFQKNVNQIQISGLVLATNNVTRLSDYKGIPAPPNTTKQPAISINGAIMANRVSLANKPNRPFVLVFNATKTDITDAPGFFTWKTAGWVESN